MALTEKRYMAVDTQLQDMQASLMALAAEIQEATPPTDLFCHPCQAAMKAADTVENLRYLLAIAEAKRQVSKKQEKSLRGSARGMQTAGWDQVAAVKWLTGLLG